MELWRSDIVPLFEGESWEAFRDDFVQTSVNHNDVYSVLDVAKYVFRNSRDPDRAYQASQIWLKDLELRERIRLQLLKGPATEKPNVTVVDLQAYALAMINDKLAPFEVKVKCLEFLARTIEGALKKDADQGQSGAGGGGTNSAEFLAALSKMLPS